MPETNPSRYPQECLMDREKLSRIDKNVEVLTENFNNFISSEGPFSDVKTRVKVLEEKTEGLWWRVTGMISAIMGLAWLVISKFLGGEGG